MAARGEGAAPFPELAPGRRAPLGAFPQRGMQTFLLHLGYSGNPSAEENRVQPGLVVSTRAPAVADGAVKGAWPGAPLTNHSEDSRPLWGLSTEGFASTSPSHRQNKCLGR